MKKTVFFVVISVLLTSCGFGNKSEVERLRAENDSLQNAKIKLEQEVNDYFSTLNNVQQNIEKIKDAQNVISVNPLSENSPQDVRNKIRDDMAYLNEMIQSNQDELEKMREKLKRSAFKLDDVELTLAKLKQQLQQESLKVAKLQTLLLRKDSVINEMGEVVEALGQNVKDLSKRNEENMDVIQEQEQTIHSAWYAIGSRKELKDNKIVSSDGLFSTKKVLQSDFNKNYFVKVDSRETRVIPLYTNSKVRVLTSHSNSSYLIEKQDNSYVLRIVEPSEFWRVSKYLVIEID